MVSECCATLIFVHVNKYMLSALNASKVKATLWKWQLWRLRFVFALIWITEDGKAKIPICVKVSFSCHRMKDCFFTRCLKPLNFRAERVCWILSMLVIEMQLPEKWEVCCVKYEQGAMHWVGGSHSNFASGTLSGKCCSFPCHPSPGVCSSSFLMASMLACGTDLCSVANTELVGQGVRQAHIACCSSHSLT